MNRAEGKAIVPQRRSRARITGFTSLAVGALIGAALLAHALPIAAQEAAAAPATADQIKELLA